MFVHFSFRWHFVNSKNVHPSKDVYLKINRQRHAYPDGCTLKLYDEHVRHARMNKNERDENK